MVGDEPYGEVELRDYLQVFVRRRWIVASTALVVLGLALLFSYLQTPVYAGNARLKVEPKETTSPFDPVTGVRNDTDQFVATEIEVLEGEEVGAQAAKTIGTARPVRVRQVGTTSVVEITAESTDPAEAAKITNAYADAYIEYRRGQGINESLASQEVVQAQINDLQAQIDELDARITAGDGSIGSLESQRRALLDQQALFDQTLNQLQVSTALTTGGAEIVRRAEVPTAPVRPTPVRNSILALVIGGVLGVGLAFLVEHLDDSVGRKEDLDRFLDGVPVVGEIPEVEGWKETHDTRLVARDVPRSVPAEAYKALRTSIGFLGLHHPVKTLQVTSPAAGEGKTTTLANLGVTLAVAGQKVIIVCCDLRRPRIHEFFGLSNDIGFTSTLLGQRPAAAALQEVPGVPRLRLLASGAIPPNPSELLSSGRTAEVLSAVSAEADIVLIDSPPVLPVTDALVLFRHVDAALMVVSAGNTTRREAAEALSRVRQVDGPLIGMVLNGVKAGRGYGYRYRHGYGVDQADGKATGSSDSMKETKSSSNGQDGRNDKGRRRVLRHWVERASRQLLIARYN